MKFYLSTIALAVLAALGNASPMIRQVAESSSCTLSGTYTSGADVSSCSAITISSLTVPAGVTLDLSDVKSGATITFSGTTKFGTKVRSPLSTELVVSSGVAD
jgi:polygalacturonase